MKYCKIRFHFRTSAEITFPANPGNTFRGALGFQLQRLACIQRNNRYANGSICNSCITSKNCAYALTYGTGPAHLGHRFLSGNSDVPHLMVIDVGFPGNQPIPAGDRFEFALQLYGRGIDVVPHLVIAAQKAGMIGLTCQRVPCSLERVTDDFGGTTLWATDQDEFTMPQIRRLLLAEPSLIPGEPTEINLRFITPVAFKDRSSGSMTLKPDFDRIIGSLMRRYTAFEASEGRKVQWNFAAISHLAHQVRLAKSNLEPVCWERFSAKQRLRIPIAGVIGRVCYHGPGQNFLELLQAGEILRCGRSTTFGQGRISLNNSVPDTGIASGPAPDREPSQVFCD